MPYIFAAQAQKHVTHNEALRILDAVVQIAVADRDLATPPSSPTNGDRYIVAASASGAWSGQSNKIAAWQDGAWTFFTPREGWLAWIADDDALVAWDGSAWAATTTDTSINPAQLVGVNTTADSTNRLAVKSNSVLMSHDDVTPGTGDMRQVLNKSETGNTVSQLYQSGWSGRAETGLSGDDDFRIKVSPDGSTWHDALVIDRATGGVAMPRKASPWKGRKWVAVGTSISAQGQYTTPLAGLIEAQLVNLAVGGATLTGSMIPAQIPLIPADADVVTLEAGTNDFPSGIALGNVGDTTTATFCGALHVAIDAIMDRAPSTVIVLLTPFSSGPGPDGSLPSHVASQTYLATDNGTRLRQWQQAVRDVAAWTGWPLIDVGRDAGLNWWTVGEYTYDGLHPIGDGGERMARFIADQLIEMRPRAGTYVPVSTSTLDPTAKGANAVLSNGNLDLSTTTTNWTSAKGSLSHNTGQRYFEARLVAHGANLNTLVGLADGTASSAGLNTYPGAFNYSIAVRPDRIFNNANSVIATGTATPSYSAAANDAIMVAVDFDTGLIWFGRNGTWLTGTPATGSTTGRNGSFAPGLALFPCLGVAGAPNIVRLATAAADQLHAPPAGFVSWG
jgi:hypothetical protein